MNYYNEFDKKAAAWLRELIKLELIPYGEVDERSIADVRAVDLRKYTQCHFFAGIGGWSYALQLAGWPEDRRVWTGSCPCQPFSIAGKGAAGKDERHLWPEFFRLIDEDGDVPTVFGEQVASPLGRQWLAGVQTDLETLGYTFGAADLCAASVGEKLGPHSETGKDLCGRLFKFCKTTGWGLKFFDFIAYKFRKEISECLVGAPHIRQRLWWVADNEHAGPQGGLPRRSDSQREDQHRHSGCSGATGGLCDSDSDRRAQGRKPGEAARHWGATEPASSNPWQDSSLIPCADGKARRIESGLEPLVDGLPGRVAMLRGLGNAIVPQVAAEFILASEEALNDS